MSENITHIANNIEHNRLLGEVLASSNAGYELKKDLVSNSSPCIAGCEAESDRRPNRNESEESESVDVSVEARPSWGGRIEFLLTCVGYAVGLGNVWRFPYLCYRHGGGAFLIPYFTMLAIVGLPLFYLELSLGQFSSQGPISVWKISPIWKGLGYGMVFTNWLISVYYNVIISHVLFYLGSSFTTQLPWAHCNNKWNTLNCSTIEDRQNMSASGNWTYLNGSMTTPTEEYYRYVALQESGGIEEMGPISWQLLLCLLAGWTVVFLVLIRGVSSLGKVAYFTALFPYIMLTVLLVRGVLLEGAVDGILFYLKPQFHLLLSARVWSDAATQIFFSLSACTGGLIAMASFNKFSQCVDRDALLVPCINCGTSFYAGFVIFAVLGFMAKEKGVPIENVVTGGPGLAFIVYPEAISRMPAAPLWSVCFFVMMATLGFGSQFSIVETLMAALPDEFPFLRRTKVHNTLFRLAVVVVSLLFGLSMLTRGGIYLLNLIDSFISGFPLLIIGMLECLVVSWIYGVRTFMDDIAMMIGHRPGAYWMGTWAVLSPLTLFVVIVLNVFLYEAPTYNNGRYHYPPWAIGIGFLLAALPLLCIPLWMLYYYCSNGGWARLKAMSVPDTEWGPREPKNRTGRYAAALELEANGAPSGAPSCSLAAAAGCRAAALHDPATYRIPSADCPSPRTHLLTDAPFAAPHRPRQETEQTSLC